MNLTDCDRLMTAHELTCRNVEGSSTCGNCDAETQLAGWAYEIRTPESVRKEIHLNWRITFEDLVETAPQRLFAFELRRGEYAAAARISAGVGCAEGRTASRLRWSEGRDDELRAPPLGRAFA